MEPHRPLIVELDITKLNDKEFRTLYHNEKFRWAISFQVQTIRKSKGWSVDELAGKAGINRTTVMRIENPKSRWGYSFNSLLKIAAAFDCALICKFVAWSRWLREMAEIESGNWQAPVPFDEDLGGEMAALQAQK